MEVIPSSVNALNCTLSQQKPWLTPGQQITHLKNKGVKFKLISETDAENYLTKNNNFFRLRSYRNGFAKVEAGKRKGEYANLDFKMLVDLSIVDMLLRNVMLRLTLDVEHFSKVMLLCRIETENEDGYAIVEDYIASYDEERPDGTVINRIKNEITQQENSIFVGDLIAKYPSYDFPVWAFLEVISFGTFIYFVRFCSERFSDRKLENDFYLLHNVRALRNACAHNNCIINDLMAQKGFRPNQRLLREVAAIEEIRPHHRRSRLSNKRIHQLATTLCLHKERASLGVREHAARDIREFSKRMLKHIDYYVGNGQIQSSFYFISKLIDNWYPEELLKCSQ